MTAPLPVSRTGATDREVEAGVRRQPDYWWTADHEQARQEALAAIAAERARQDEKWGQQNHPDGTGEHWEALTGRHVGAAQEMAEAAQRRTDEAAQRGECTWSLILDEEVTEALAEEDPSRLRAELVQVAAVAAQWVEAIDRRARAALLAEQRGGRR